MMIINREFFISFSQSITEVKRDQLAFLKLGLTLLLRLKIFPDEGLTDISNSNMIG